MIITAIFGITIWKQASKANICTLTITTKHGRALLAFQDLMLFSVQKRVTESASVIDRMLCNTTVCTTHKTDVSTFHTINFLLRIQRMRHTLHARILDMQRFHACVVLTHLGLMNSVARGGGKKQGNFFHNRTRSVSHQICRGGRTNE